MLLTTIYELKNFFPTHAMDNIEIMQGAIDNSENDFLKEKIGKPLYEALQTYYNNIVQEDNIRSVIPPYDKEPSPWTLLLNLCQRVVVYNAFYRSADVQAVSINNSGFNKMSAEGYDASDEKSMERFKTACNKEAHAAVNRLLVTLEEWAKETEGEYIEEKNNIVRLWRDSKYFYLVEGMLINTASCLNRFVDIYDSREKFVSMIPDLRYIQDLYMVSEMGGKLIAKFVTLSVEGTSDSVTSYALALLQRVMSLFLEARNKTVFRKEAHDEAVMMMKQTVGFFTENYDHLLTILGEEAFEDSPIKKIIERKKEEQEQREKQEHGREKDGVPPQRDGNVKERMFFMPGLN